MTCRLLFLAALACLLVQAPNAWSQPPRRNPLREAEDILKTAGLPSSQGLSVKHLEEVVKKSPSLAGTVWRTTVDSDEYTFSGDGKVQGVFLVTGLSSGKGTYTQNGDSFEIKWGGNYVWRGKIISEDQIVYTSDDGFGNTHDGLKLKRKK
jgi:hypothetical protein